jgi:hypothetical protein
VAADDRPAAIRFFGPVNFAAALTHLGFLCAAVRNFLIFLADGLGRSRLRTGFSLKSGRAGLAAARRQVVGNARKDSELDLSLGTACFARGSVIRAVRSDIRSDQDCFRAHPYCKLPVTELSLVTPWIGGVWISCSI